MFPTPTFFCCPVALDRNFGFDAALNNFMRLLAHSSTMTCIAGDPTWAKSIGKIFLVFFLFFLIAQQMRFSRKFDHNNSNARNETD